MRLIANIANDPKLKDKKKKKKQTNQTKLNQIKPNQKHKNRHTILIFFKKKRKLKNNTYPYSLNIF